MSQHMGTRRVHPDEERLAVLLGLVDERDGGGRYHLVKGRHVVFDAGHWTRRQRTFVDDLLLAHLAPPGLHRGVVYVRRPAVVYVRRPAMDEIARTDHGLPFRRIGVIERILHCVQVIKITEKLVETMVRREKLVPVAEVVLAELAGFVA